MKLQHWPIGAFFRKLIKGWRLCILSLWLILSPDHIVQRVNYETFKVAMSTAISRDNWSGLDSRLNICSAEADWDGNERNKNVVPVRRSYHKDVNTAWVIWYANCAGKIVASIEETHRWDRQTLRGKFKLQPEPLHHPYTQFPPPP